MDTVEPWIALLVQVPLVGVFIWYSLQIAKRTEDTQRMFIEALDKRDLAYTERNKAVVDIIGNVNSAIIAELKALRQLMADHDLEMRDRLAISKQRRSS